MRLRNAQVDYPGDPPADPDRRRAGAAAAAAAGTDTGEAEEAGHSFADDADWKRESAGDARGGEREEEGRRLRDKGRGKGWRIEEGGKRRTHPDHLISCPMTTKYGPLALEREVTLAHARHWGAGVSALAS